LPLRRGGQPRRVAQDLSDTLGQHVLVLRLHPRIATLAPMKREDARDLIRREWIRWRNAQLPLYPRPTGKDAMAFYDHLRTSQPDLLDFPFDGDRWLIVHGWLLSPDAISD